MSRIIRLEGDIYTKDKKARKCIEQIWTKIETINERTKIHTLDIKKLTKELKKALEK